MTFGEALEALNNGAFVARKGRLASQIDMQADDWCIVKEAD